MFTSGRLLADDDNDDQVVQISCKHSVNIACCCNEKETFFRENNKVMDYYSQGALVECD